MSVQGFSTSQDGEIANFRALQQAVYASEARRKEEQRQRRIAMGLPELEDDRGVFQRLLRKGKSRSSEGAKFGSLNANRSSKKDGEVVVSIQEFLKAK